MPFLNLALFLATLLTTTMQGALERHGYASMFPLQDGLSFSLPLMAILLCHEMGHYLAARWHHVPASLPYFVPLPPGVGMFGTMGAVILQSRTSDRRKLIDIGAAGPLAHEHHAREDPLAAVALHAQALAVAVASVAR